MSWAMMGEQFGWGVIEEEGWRKGPWTAEEDRLLTEYVRLHGEGRWNSVARLTGRTDNEIKNYWRTHFKKKAKLSPDNSDQAKARTLKRQHFQQQLLQQKQQQQYLKLNESDMKRMMSLLEETEPKAPFMPQLRQEMGAATSCPNMVEEQSLFYPMGNGNETSNEDVVWDGLWNLDDYQW
ncbi:hypothetical protein Gogos_012917, partial [Gossypium gossypioides]|nr:hypothetical protein [Gossypium gossypioides]